jgi:Sugar phosphate isomerases/epimerases
VFHLSISNIAWRSEDDESIYKKVVELGFSGIEIAPTRIVSNSPYDHIEEAKKWKNELELKYGLLIPSMQSIWYGRIEKIFGSEEDRRGLIDYTKKAVDFAEAVGCKNLVFGCPKNRCIPEDGDEETAKIFFQELGDYAYEHDTVIAIEPNPAIYNTNFLNSTSETISFIERIVSKGIRLNLDAGAMVENDETVDVLSKKGHLIHHVHISEPGLGVIKKHGLHRNLRDFLHEIQYAGFVSLEMNNESGLQDIYESLKYVKEVFQ